MFVRVRTHGCACVHVCPYVCVCARELYGVVFNAQPRWADVMLGSGPCLCSVLAVVGATRKVVVLLPRGPSAAIPGSPVTCTMPAAFSILFVTDNDTRGRQISNIAF